jgi:hypothetical protein
LFPIFVVTLLLQGSSSLLLNRGFPEYEGSVPGLPLHGPVEVLRDSWGIPIFMRKMSTISWWLRVLSTPRIGSGRWRLPAAWLKDAFPR